MRCAPNNIIHRRRWICAGSASVLAIGLVLLASCDRQAPADTIERNARQFVTLSLALGQHDPAEVDSFFGPPSLQPTKAQPDLATLRAAVARLELAIATAPADRRQQRLHDRAGRLAALVTLLQSDRQLPFDDEAQTLFGIVPTVLDKAKFAQARKDLDVLLPGPGALSQRVEAFRQRYIVPERLRPALFARALAECRARTMKHWRLPASEKLDVEWTSEVGAAWHRYQGGLRSVLQINPQAVAFLGSIVDVACHEGYPGHHAQFLLAEAAAGTGGLPIEDRIVLLRSPGSVVREGAADFGVALVFPAAERRSFERDVLFSLAGFPPDEAARFSQVRELLDQLAPAALPILRSYRDHAITPEAAAAVLDRDALIASPQALLGFVDRFGAYVVGYTGVREQVRSVVDSGLDPSDPRRWARLRCVIREADLPPLGGTGAADCRRDGGGGG